MAISELLKEIPDLNDRIEKGLAWEKKQGNGTYHYTNGVFYHDNLSLIGILGYDTRVKLSFNYPPDKTHHENGKVERLKVSIGSNMSIISNSNNLKENPDGLEGAVSLSPDSPLVIEVIVDTKMISRSTDKYLSEKKKKPHIWNHVYKDREPIALIELLINNGIEIKEKATPSERERYTLKELLPLLELLKKQWKYGHPLKDAGGDYMHAFKANRGVCEHFSDILLEMIHLTGGMGYKMNLSALKGGVSCEKLLLSTCSV